MPRPHIVQNRGFEVNIERVANLFLTDSCQLHSDSG